MGNKITEEEFRKRLYGVHKDKIKLTGEYKNISTKTRFECFCGHIWNTLPYTLTSNKSGCPKCANNIKLTFDYVKNYIESFGYELLSDEYINNQIKLQMKCPKGHLWYCNYNNFKNGNRCGVCANNQVRLIDEVREYIESIGYELISNQYVNRSSNLEIKCDKGHLINMTFSGLLRGNRCAICAGNARKTIEEISEFASKNGFILLSKEYKNAFGKLKFMCREKHIFERDWAKFQTRQTCPICKESKGEKRIYEFLEMHNINNNRQYIFPDLLSDLGNSLRFDFAILDQNENIKLLIEYDGIFHYEKQYDDDGFERLQYHDALKNQYCKNNNIPLLRIPYWDFDNLENILKQAI